MRMPLCLSLCINVHSCISDTKFLFIVQLELDLRVVANNFLLLSCELHMYMSSDFERNIWTSLLGHVPVMYYCSFKWFATHDVNAVLISGTSDPYVKFKSDGKQIYKSKTVQKNLNPQWNEKFCVPIEDITVPLILKVLDFDRVGNDDPMGRAVVDLAAIEIDK